MILTTAQSELISLVNFYKRRTFDEDIKDCEKLGGKYYSTQA